MAIVYTGGSFSQLHLGHIDLLKRCSELGYVVVALNKDDFIERYKGKKPIDSFEDRAEMLLSTRYVDEVIANEDGEDSKTTILKVNPDYIVIGSDWLKKDYCKQMGFTPEWLEQQNITLVYVPRHRDISTTKIKERNKND